MLYFLSASGEPRAPQSVRLPPNIAHGFRGIQRLGRVVQRPAVQPAGTSKAVVYEVGKLYQLDRNHSLLVASMREEGGRDAEAFKERQSNDET
jgi:hypothetical protein